MDASEYQERAYEPEELQKLFPVSVGNDVLITNILSKVVLLPLTNPPNEEARLALSMTFFGDDDESKLVFGMTLRQARWLRDALSGWLHHSEAPNAP